MSPARAIVIHGHFYQPPRENPWLDVVEVQDSAAPYHDWNERITAECYAPNTAARRVDAHDRIIDIVNNYEWISFNFGPTLFAWLERHAPDVHAKIVEADRASVDARGGHGNACGQVYNHMIMPLATRARQGHPGALGDRRLPRAVRARPEGMWLAETAVDVASLEVLAEAGIQFTILAPRQARRVRQLGERRWPEMGGGIDPAARIAAGSPRPSVVLFFYDGIVSRSIAFERLLDRGECSSSRLHQGSRRAREQPQLMHVATDGETYGHHQPHGDMALAYVLERRIESDGPTLTNYGEFLAAHPPQWEVEIHERPRGAAPTAIERWRSDCGCKTRGDWHQRWRAPLRRPSTGSGAARPLLQHPRPRVLPGPVGGPRRLRRRGPRPRAASGSSRSSPATAVRSSTPPPASRPAGCSSCERNRMLMYTSCGWFFDEIAALEPVQIFKYAAMVMQYITTSAADGLEPELVRRLAAAPSNAPRFVHGGEVYRRLVRRPRNLSRVVRTTRSPACSTSTPRTRASMLPCRAAGRGPRDGGGTTLAVAHVRVSSETTGETREMMSALAHFGGHDFSCGVRTWDDQATYDALKSDLLARCARQSVADLVRGLDEYFPGGLSSLSHLFLDERRRVLANVIRATSSATRRRTGDLGGEPKARPLSARRRRADPEALAIIARHVLEQEVSAELQSLPNLAAIPDRCRRDRRRGQGAGPDARPHAPAIHHAARGRPRARPGRRVALARTRRAGDHARRGRAASGHPLWSLGDPEPILPDLDRAAGRAGRAAAACERAGLQPGRVTRP